MRRIIILLLSLALGGTAFASSEKETALFDSDGAAVAFIDRSDENIIYLWNGRPVAYLVKNGTDICVYGFNGDNLGWFEEGIVWDQHGLAVGFVSGAILKETKKEAAKGPRSFKPLKMQQKGPLPKPTFKKVFSDSSLNVFLLRGVLDPGAG